MMTTRLGKRIRMAFQEEYGKNEGNKFFREWVAKNRGVTDKRKKEVARKTTKSGRPTKWSTMRKGVAATGYKKKKMM